MRERVVPWKWLELGLGQGPRTGRLTRCQAEGSWGLPAYE